MFAVVALFDNGYGDKSVLEFRKSFTTAKGFSGVIRLFRSDALSLACFIIVGAIIAMGIGQAAFVRIAKAKLDSVTLELLNQSSRVAWVSIDTFADVNNDKYSICSDANLEQMRYIIFQRRELYDIGRTHNGQIICTANWGRLKLPIKLPKPQRHLRNGNLLWMHVRSAMDNRLVLDMAAHGDVIVFQPPTTFTSYERLAPFFSAVILSHDGKFVYSTLNDADGLLKNFRDGVPGFELGGKLMSSFCADDLDVCVVSNVKRINLVNRYPIIALELACVGGVAAGGFGFLEIRRRRRHSVPAEQVKRVIADGRLELAYQPLVRIRDQRMVGAEALLRVRDEYGQPVTPDIFVGIAEEANLMGKITRIVVHKSLTEMKDRLIGEREFYLSINVSVKDVTDPYFQSYLEEESDRLSIPRHRIVLELTERSTTDGERLLAAVSRLRSRGYGMYIDDLGTGYSSLALLSKLPITGVKVDRIFTQSIGKEAVSSTIVEKICSLAESLKVAVVIEGVETEEQMAYIRGLHPEAIGQGYLWSVPVSANQFAEVLYDAA